jgi:hypothetical protein
MNIALSLDYFLFFPSLRSAYKRHHFVFIDEVSYIKEKIACIIDVDDFKDDVQFMEIDKVLLFNFLRFKFFKFLFKKVE